MARKPNQGLEVLGDARAQVVLARLHAEADRQTVPMFLGFAAYLPRLLLRRPLPWERLEPKLADKFIAVLKRQAQRVIDAQP